MLETSFGVLVLTEQIIPYRYSHPCRIQMLCFQDSEAEW